MGFENFNFKRKFNYKVFLPLLLGLASVQSLEASNTEPSKPAEAKPVNTEISSNDALDQSSVRHMTEQARATELRAEGFNPCKTLPRYSH